MSDVDRAQKDSKPFRMRALVRLCDARGIKAKELVADRTMLQQIPTRAQMQEDLLQSFYDMYANFPNTSDFMERIVRRLAPEYGSDTVRTAILKKFILGAGDNFKRFNTKQISAWAMERFDKNERDSFDSLTNQQQRTLIVSKLDDSIFAHKSIEIMNADVFLLIADRIEKYTSDDMLNFDGVVLGQDTALMIDALMMKYKLYKKDASDSEKIFIIANAVKQGILSELELPDEFQRRKNKRGFEVYVNKN